MKKAIIQTGRECAFLVLQEVFDKGAYANLALTKQLNAVIISPQERRFATELVYGTVKSVGTLDWILSHYMKRCVEKTDPVALNILRLGMYQLRFLDKVPDSAAVDESVKLGHRFGHSGIAGFVNAVLRSFLREPQKCSFPEREKNSALHLALTLWHPQWLVERWIGQFGLEAAEAMCKFNNEHPPLVLRTNTMRISREELLEKLRASGAEVKSSKWTPEGIVCSKLADNDPLELLKRGFCLAQDESSMMVAHVLAPQPGEFVIDACAAPGGKTTHIATLMNNKGRIVAADVHAHKMSLIRENANRLGLRSILTVQKDAATLPNDYAGKADRVLVDAPCSGLGVLRRRPDARWRKKDTLVSFPPLQQSILLGAAQCVKPGGVLVYSTCTTEPAENAEMVKWFLKTHSDFYLDNVGRYCPFPTDESMLTLLPFRDEVDGFFIARLIRRGEAASL